MWCLVVEVWMFLLRESFRLFPFHAMFNFVKSFYLDILSFTPISTYTTTQNTDLHAVPCLKTVSVLLTFCGHKVWSGALARLCKTCRKCRGKALITRSLISRVGGSRDTCAFFKHQQNNRLFRLSWVDYIILNSWTKDLIQHSTSGYVNIYIAET